MVEKQMKTFNVGDTRYIVNDAEAREDIADLQDAMSPLDVSAESEDVGKALKAKTVSGGKVTEYELGYAAIIDDTLSVAGEAADAKETGDAIADLDAAKVNKPTASPNGTSGQLLRTNGDGTTTWVDQGLPTDQQTADAVEAWLDDHPEATTTVQDGAITRAKLDSNLQGTVDAVDDLIIVSDTQPVSEDNELWIQETNGSEVEVPDIDEFNDLKSQIGNIEDVIYPNQDVVFSQYSGELSAVNQYIQIGTLKNGHSYRFVLKFSAAPIALTAIRTSKTSSSSGNVDTITNDFVGDSWTEGKTCIYTPSVDGITRIQIQFNSSYSGGLSVDLTVYDYTKETTTAITELEIDLSETQEQVDGMEYTINLEDAYNLLPPTGYEVGKYISTNGTITNHATLVLSDYIEVDPAQGYICNWTKTATIVNGDSPLTGNINTFDRLQFCFFDANKIVIPFTDSTSTPSKAIPQNAKYIRVTVLNETVYPYARLIYGNYNSQPIVRICDYHKTYPDKYAEANTGLESFNMVMFGDSITHGSLSVNDGGTSYVDYANDYLHSNIINVGFGGTRMTYTLSDAGLFCFYHLCECIVSDDPTAWDDLDDYAQNGNTTYLPHLQTLKAIDWTKIHAIGLMYGANDYASNTPVGTAYNETLTNFDGACAYGLKLLLTKYPHLQVLILSPFDREMTVGDASTMTDRLANTAGLIMSDYGDSLENVVSRIHCALIRTDKLFGINQYSILDYAPDGTHPRSNMAQKRLGWLFAQSVRNNLTPFNG